MTCAFFALERVEIFLELNIYKTRKMTSSSPLLIILSFQGYCRETGMRLFTWSLTSNFDDSLFKTEQFLVLMSLGLEENVKD